MATNASIENTTVLNSVTLQQTTANPLMIHQSITHGTNQFLSKSGAINNNTIIEAEYNWLLFFVLVGLAIFLVFFVIPVLIILLQNRSNKIRRMGKTYSYVH
ncbi:hypothetical protein DICVIV_07227 [Dictyocaulus viviparus]|uniref:Uncharacterized protein n=1 Tax=Dictyocaulus viviparus TaxID=29172 RepID=A0A0D8XQ06_DICVI|nr:hypothetical protein DICVIV_07227 [Dictyocaulus viviparus]